MQSPQQKPMSRRRMAAAMDNGAEIIQDLTQRLIITTMVAHFKMGEITVESAARACSMPVDNFRRCFSIVNDEARRMLASIEAVNNPLSAPLPLPKPLHRRIWDKITRRTTETPTDQCQPNHPPKSE